MKAQLQKFRYAATGRWAVSIRTYLLVFPFGFLVTTEREYEKFDISLTDAITIAFAGELAGFLYLFLAQEILLGQRKMKLQPISRCFFVWISTGFIRGLAVAYYGLWSFGIDLNFNQRLLPATFYTTVVMAFAAIYFGTIERKRTELEALNSLENLLSWEESGLRDREIAQRAAAAEMLESQLLPQVQALRAGIEITLGRSERLDATSEESEKDLRFLYEQSIEISHALEEQRQLLNSKIEKPGASSTPFAIRSYWSAFFPKILSVRITIIFYTLGVLNSQFPRNGIDGVLTGMVGLLPLLAILIPLAQLVKRIVRFRSFMIFAALIGVFTVSFFYNLTQPYLGLGLENPYLPWYSALKTAYGLYLASVIASLLVEVSGKRDVAVRRGSFARATIEQLSMRDSTLEKAIYEGRFGALQGKISGVTMALHLMNSETLGRISLERKLELLKSANQLLGESLATIEEMRVPL